MCPRCYALPSPRCCNDVLSASSIRHILRVLRAALQDADDEEMLSRNVARLVQLRVTDERRVRSFTRTEALRFLQTAEGHRPTHHGPLHSRWRCGGLGRRGSPGETSISTKAGLRSVRRSIEQTGSCGWIRSRRTRRLRFLPIPAPLIRILGAHRHRQGEERIAAGSRWRHRSGLHHCPGRLHRAA